MGKIERKYLAHYINAGTAEDENYERLGQDLAALTPELAASVETKKKILGQTSILISSCEKTAAVTPYYAQTDSPLFAKLQGILDGSLVLDDLKTQVVEVKLWEAEGGGTTFPAIREEAYIEITSYGGDTTGYQIPFTIHYTGHKETGTFDVESRTFTKG